MALIVIVFVVFLILGMRHASKQPPEYHQKNVEKMKSAAADAAIVAAGTAAKVIKDGE